jgi:hypothetical protein
MVEIWRRHGVLRGGQALAVWAWQVARQQQFLKHAAHLSGGPGE